MKQLDAAEAREYVTQGGIVEDYTQTEWRCRCGTMEFWNKSNNKWTIPASVNFDRLAPFLACHYEGTRDLRQRVAQLEAEVARRDDNFAVANRLRAERDALAKQLAEVKP